MKDLREVTCVILDGPDEDRRIDGIGGWTGSKRWTLTIDEAISEMEDTTFYINHNHKMVPIIKKARNGRAYLTTATDDSQKNNLLELNPC